MSARAVVRGGCSPSAHCGKVLRCGPYRAGWRAHAALAATREPSCAESGNARAPRNEEQTELKVQCVVWGEGGQIHSAHLPVCTVPRPVRLLVVQGPGCGSQLPGRAAAARHSRARAHAPPRRGAQRPPAADPPHTHTHTRARTRRHARATRCHARSALAQRPHGQGQGEEEGRRQGQEQEGEAPAICTADEDLAPFGLRCDDILLTPMGLTAVVAGVKYEDPTTKVRRRGVRPRCPPAPQPARAASSTHAWLVRRRRKGTRARATKGHTRALLLPGTLRG